VSVTDDDLGSGIASASVTVNNVSPIVATLSATSVNENGTVTLSGTYNDVGTQDTHTLTIDWGEGVPQTVPVSGGTFSFTHQYLDDNPTATASDVYTIGVTLTDDDTGTDTGSASTTITNVAPELLTLAATSVDENGTVTLSGTYSDVGTQDTLTATISWGEGVPVTLPVSGGTFSFTHQYVDDSPTGTASDVYTIGVTLTDDDTGTATGNTTTTITNLAPVITGSITGPTAAVPGQPLTYSVAGYTDVGTQDTHTTSWQVLDSASLVVASGPGLVLNFTPTVADTYTVRFKVSDDDTLWDTETLTLGVSLANTQTGVCCSDSGTSLVVGSPTVNDRIHVNPISNDGTLQVQITNRTNDTLVYQQTFAPPAGAGHRL
jgi:large repetitive protein